MQASNAPSRERAAPRSAASPAKRETNAGSSQSKEPSSADGPGQGGGRSRRGQEGHLVAGQLEGGHGLAQQQHVAQRPGANEKDPQRRASAVQPPLRQLDPR